MSIIFQPNIFQPNIFATVTAVMDVDTVADRFSMLDWGGPESHSIIIPTGGIEVYDRLHLMWLYGGVAAAPAQVVTTPSDRRIIFMRSNRTIPR